MGVALYTSYYASPAWREQRLVAVQTSIQRPRWWQGDIDHVRRITLPYAALHADDWQRLYHERLDKIDTNDLRARLDEISARHQGRGLALLCFEKDASQCHRSILARWLTDHGFGPVPEAAR